MKKLSVMLPVMALMGACAPVTAGTQVSAPLVQETPFAPVVLVPGQTIYVQYTYPAGMLGIQDKYLKDLKIDFNNRDNGNNVRSVEKYASWLMMTPEKLPKGVEVKLDQAYLVKDVTETDNTRDATEIRFLEKVRVILKITAAVDADLKGVDLLTLKFMNDNVTKDMSLFLTTESTKE